MKSPLVSSLLLILGATFALSLLLPYFGLHIFSSAPSGPSAFSETSRTHPETTQVSQPHEIRKRRSQPVRLGDIEEMLSPDDSGGS